MKILNLNLAKNNNDRGNSSRKYSQIINSQNSLDEEKKESPLEFEEIHEALVDGYNRKKYRKVFEFIDTKEAFLRQTNIINHLFFSHMRMNCILKIIEKKFNKYYKSSQIKGIEKWFKFADISLHKFSILISKLYKAEIEEQCEYILLYHIKIYYFRSLYCKFKNENKDYINYLILCEEIIKNVIEKITFPETFIYIIRIYLLISNLLLQNNSIYSAINYLLVILHICKVIKYEQIELEIKKKKLNDSLFITSYPYGINKENIIFNNFISEINFLSALSFCLLGACFENLNEFILANSTFRQAKWITENLLNNENNEYSCLLKLLEELTDKSKKEKDIILIISKINMVKFINKYKNKPQRKGFDTFENKQLIKYKKIEKKLSKLDLKESEQLQHMLLNDNENKPKSKNVKLMTNNILLLNYLSSEQFKPVIYKLKSMNIYNMNKETEMLITKKLEYIQNKNNKDSIQNGKFKKSKSNDSQTFSNNNTSDRLRKVRNRKRFQTEINKDLTLIKKDNIDNLKKSKKSNINERKEEKRQIKFSSKDILKRNNKFNFSLKDKRKMSVGVELKGFFKIDKLILNNSSSVEEESFSKIKEYSKKSSSYKKSSENTNNSFVKTKLLESPIVQHKISFNNDIDNEILKTDINKEKNKSNYKIKKKTNKKNKVPKPLKNKKLDKYIFNKIYIKKREHIDTLINKEYKFQKGILRNKSYEKFPFEKYEPEKNKKDAEFFYIKTLEEKLKILEDKIQTLGGKSKNNFYEEKKLKRKVISYQNRACISLNYKDKERYSKLIKDINLNNSENEKKKESKNIGFYHISHSIDFNKKKINENNNIQMNILGGNIEKIERKIKNKFSKIKNNEKKIGNLFPSITNVNIMHKNKSSNVIINKNLIQEFKKHNRLSLISIKELEKNRQSVNINENILSEIKFLY